MEANGCARAFTNEWSRPPRSWASNSTAGTIRALSPFCCAIAGCCILSTLRCWWVRKHIAPPTTLASCFSPCNIRPSLPCRELHIPRLLQNRRVVRGVIAAGTNSQNLLDALADRQLPIVCLGNNIVGDWNSEDYSAVYFDDIGGAQEATGYLQSLGHRDIWYIGNCQRTWYARRSAGYCRAMDEAGLTPLIRDLNIDNSRRPRLPGHQIHPQRRARGSPRFLPVTTPPRAAFTAPLPTTG